MDMQALIEIVASIVITLAVTRACMEAAYHFGQHMVKRAK